MLYVKQTKCKGRGVFTTSTLQSGVVIESCPVIVIPQNQFPLINQTKLHDYYFAWGKNGALLLGFGSLYNHSDHPNAKVEKSIRNKYATILAIRNIEVDEEIMINYRSGTMPLWFKVKA